MGIELHHPATGNTITVDDERAAAVHAESGWERVDAGSAPEPERPAEGAPPRKWLAYAAAVGLDVDESQFESLDELVAEIDAHLASPVAVEDDEADEATTETDETDDDATGDDDPEET